MELRAVLGFVVCLTCLTVSVEGQACPAGWRTHRTYCYRFSAASMRWSDARDVCQVHGGDLLSLETVNERNWVIRTFKGFQTHGKFTANWWAGLNNKEYPTVWSWANGMDIAVGVLNWAPGAPDDSHGTQRCGAFTSGGLMADKDCESSNRYICRKPRNQPVLCDADHGWQSINGKCFKYYSGPTSWNRAVARCDHDGGEIVTIDTEDDEVTMHELSLSYKKPLWIGLKSVQTPGATNGFVWKWTNNSTLVASYWHSIPSVTSAHKNDTCVVVNNNVNTLYAWSTITCNANRAYICRKPEGTCLPGWVGHRSLCYQFDLQYKLTFPAATNYCSQQGAELLRIDRSSTQLFLQSYMREIRDSGVGSFWIGATDNNHDDGPFSWTNNKNVSYKFWTGHNRTAVNTKGKQDCAYIPSSDVSGHWRTTFNCQSARQFVCMIPMGKAPISIPSTPRPYFGCARNWKLHAGYCYYVNDTAADWLTARDACQKSQIWADLVTITNRNMQGFVNSLLKKDVRYWIGLNDRSAQGSYVWLDDIYNTTYSHWRPHEPNDFHGNEKCVSNFNGVWVDYACSNKYHFICSKPSQTILGSPPPTTPPMDWTVKCGVGWESNPVTDNCYMFVDQPLSWLDARATCSHFGGGLVAIENIEEQNYLGGQITSMDSVAVWTAANDRGHELKWKWDGDKPFPYYNWAAGQPDTAHGGGTDCVAMFTQNAQWDDVNCNNRNGFICEKLGDVPHTQPPTVTTKSIPSGMVLGCRTGWRPFQDSCYQFARLRLTQENARKRCGQAGGRLASIHSNAEHNFIKGNLPKPKSSTDGFLIGLDDLEQEMMFQWEDGSPMTYTNWNPGEPNNYRSRNEDCVEIRLNTAGWNDQVCTQPFPGYICKAPKLPVSVTQSPYQQGCPTYSQGYGDKCYRTINAKMTWTAAQAHCGRGLNGTLATINDRFLQSFLASTLVYRSGVFWIGLSDRVSQGTYLWSDNSSLSFTYWTNTHTGNEASTCVAMQAYQPYGLWSNQDCTSKQGFICMSPRPGFTAPPAVSTVNPNVPCPYGWLQMGSKCLFAYTDKPHQLTFMEAGAYCNTLGGALVSLHDKTEDDLLSGTLLKPYTNKQFWIGINDRDNETGYVWTDSSAVDFTNWRHGEPNNYWGNEDCVEYATNDNKWNDVNCYMAKSFICSIPRGTIPPVSTIIPTPVSAPQCGSDPNWFLYNGKCYLLSPETGENATMTWYDARDYCTASGANFASAHSFDENNFLLSMITKRSYGSYWLGLNELSQNGYKWTDKTPTDFTYWKPNEPNDYFGAERCVQILKPYGLWNDGTCTSNSGFICEKPLNGKVVIAEPPAFPAGGCKDGFTRVPGGRNKCFKIDGFGEGAIQLNWTMARKACQNYGTSYSDIASIEDIYEEEFLLQMTKEVPTNVWIGLNDIHHGNNKFEWADNSPVVFTNWKHGEPTSKHANLQKQGKVQNCVSAKLNTVFDGGWFDFPCSRQFAYVCETRQDPSLTIQTPANTCEIPGYRSYKDSCYKLSTDKRTWAQSISACQADGGKLVSIFNTFENAFVFSLTGSKNSTPYWIGLSDQQVHGLYGWTDGYPVTYSNWGYGEPSFGTNGGCVAANMNGRWNDSDCSMLHYYVCKISAGPPPPTTMLPGECANSQLLPFGQDCYMAFVNQAHSWPEANYDCQKQGMDLVSVHSKEEMDFVFNIVAQAKQDRPWFLPNVWLGMTKGPDGAFKWSDNTAVNFLNWRLNQPSGTGPNQVLEECVEFHRDNGRWNDVDCFNDRAYVCKASKIRQTVSSFVEPTNPPYVEPTNPPYVEPTNPPYVEPTNPPYVEPTNPPYVEPTNPPYFGPTNPPYVEPTYPQQTYPPAVYTRPSTQRQNPFNPFNRLTTKGYDPWSGNNYRSTWSPPAQIHILPETGQRQRGTQQASSDNNGGMSNGAIAGVVIAGLIALALVVVAMVFLKRSGKIMNNAPFQKMDEGAPIGGFENSAYDGDAMKMESKA